jgi:hypothetical protein
MAVSVAYTLSFRELGCIIPCGFLLNAYIYQRAVVEVIAPGMMCLIAAEVLVFVRCIQKL